MKEKTVALISFAVGMQVRREFSKIETLRLPTWKSWGHGWSWLDLKRFEYYSTAAAWMTYGSSEMLPSTEIWLILLNELLALAD